MSRRTSIRALVVLALAMIFLPSAALSASMGDYCVTPPYINAVVPPSVVMLVDVSGSMGSDAYKTSSGEHSGRCSLDLTRECSDDHDCSDHGDGVCQEQASYSYGTCSNDSATGCDVDADCGAGNTCIPVRVYEGYFDPNKNYAMAADGIYYEAAVGACPSTCVSYDSCKSESAGSQCTQNINDCKGNKKWSCCNKYEKVCSSGGNKLNFDHMTRLDVLRWAMTGGRPKTCTSSDIFSCDPRTYNTSTGKSKIGTVCNDDLDVNNDGVKEGGCILQSDDGTKVAVRWPRVYDGLTLQFEKLGVQPRLGAMFFSGTTVKPDYVYVGDFTSANSRTEYPYQNLLTEVNAVTSGGTTPTGPALWDTFNYLKQVDPEYGGIPPQSGDGDRWKDPMWDCPDKGGGNCISYSCSKNFVLLLSDGLWNQGGGPPAGGSCSIDTGFTMHSADPVVPAYLMHMGFTNAQTGVATNVSATYTLGLFLGAEGAQALKNIAMYGSFENKAKTWPSDLSNYPSSTCSITDSGSTCATGKGSSCAPLPPSSSDWDTNPADGVPDTYLSANDALQIKNKIMDAILDMLARSASGTAASVLASSEGRGANIVQAIFNPRKTFDNGTTVDWTGQLHNLWYYIDPRLQSNTIREDTVGDKIENLTNDWQVIFKFDSGTNMTVVDRYSDSDGNGTADHHEGQVPADSVNSIWEAGNKLFHRDLASDPRTVWTTKEKSTINRPAMTSFLPGNATGLMPYLQATTENEAKDIINYVLGYDNVCTGTTNPCSVDANCGGAAGSCIKYRSRTVTKGGYTGVWKLGDIVTSTPKLQSPVALNNYYTIYKDVTYSEFVGSDNYHNYGTAYAGANDGMLHAFDFGIFQEAWSGQNRRYEPARLYTSDVNKLGRERWGFIPKNVLPYLTYLTSDDYCHVYSVDASPVIFDASIDDTDCADSYWNCPKRTTYLPKSTKLDLTKTSWRTVLVGSLRFGGACRATTTVCTDVNGDGSKDCVNTPVDVTEGGTANSIGYSSYFALDITDQDHPALLWEFSDPGLGFSTSGPAFIRIAARKENPADTLKSMPDTEKNGRWFIVLGSGPTGPVNSAKRQTEGRSDQSLKLFVLDLKTGTLVRTIDKLYNGETIPYAFAGSLLGGKVDYDLDYQDDVLYFGYSTKCTDATMQSNHLCTADTWTDGGVLRLVTNEDLDSKDETSTALNPSKWQLSKVMSKIGTVTAAVANLREGNSTGQTKSGWLYYGTGRYVFKEDDLYNQRILFGVKEPCIKLMGGFDPTCTTSLNFCDSPISGTGPATCGDLFNVTTGVELDPTITATKMGWYLGLESPTNTNAVAGGYTAGVNGNITTTAERVMTDPAAVPNGAVFFTTFAPSSEICTFGGNTWLWRLKYDTGSFIDMQGSALLQLSSGEIKEIDMKTAFADKIAVINSNIGDVGEGGLEGSTAGRRTGAMTGVPPVGQGLSLVISPTPIDKILHIKKR